MYISWVSSRGGEFGDKLVESDDAGFFETIHASADFKINVSIRFDFKVIFVHDFVGDKRTVDSEILVVGHGSTEVVEVFDVEAEVAGSILGV